MWNKDDFIKEVYRRTQMNYVGHSWMHTNMTIKEMTIRMQMERRRNISSLDMNVMEILKAIETTCEANVDEIVNWLNDGDNRRGNVKRGFFYDYGREIGKLISNEYHMDPELGYIPCTSFCVVLQKTKMRHDGSFGFIIKTEYSVINKETRELLKKEA